MSREFSRSLVLAEWGLTSTFGIAQSGLSAGSGSLETFPEEALICRDDGVCDVRADVKTKDLGRFRLEGADIVIQVPGLSGRLSPPPPLLGWTRARGILAHTPEHGREAKAYRLDASCIEAIRGNTARSLAYLEQAVLQGFTDFEWLLEDGDLTSVRSSPEFSRIVELARTGRTDREGATWLAKLTPFLPPGQSLFALSRAQRAAVLRDAAGTLTEAEARALVEAAPEDQKEECRALLEDPPP